jgi:hypothetical protein
MRRCWVLAATLLATVLLIERPSAAADGVATVKRAAEADAAKANKAIAARDFGGAAEAWERAFGQVPNPKWLFSAAGARRKNGELARAANEYARYLKEAPQNAPQRSAAKKELAVLALKLAQLEITADGATRVTVDGEAVDLATGVATTTYVAAGSHVVEARFKDETVKASPNPRVGEIATVVLVPAPTSSAPVAADVAAASPSEDKPPSRDRTRPLPPLAVWIGAGVTVVAGGLTIASGLDVLGQRDTFDANRSRENLEAGQDKQLRTNVLLAVTGTTAVLTAVAAIWFVDWRHRGNEANVKVGAGPGALVVRATF